MDDGRLAMTWRFPITFGALAVAAAALAAALLGHLNLIALPAGFVARIGPDEIDDLVSVLLLVGVAFLGDQLLFTRRVAAVARVEAARLHAVHATIKTVQDIVNNGLTQLQLLRFDADGHVPPESLALFDEAIGDTVTRLKSLGDLQASVEEQLAAGPGPAVPPPSPFKGNQGHR